jgi:hypothetical protein
MSRDDDDDVGHGGSSGRGDFGNTSSFSTTVSDDGRFFGIKLSPELASSLNAVRGGLLDWARRKGEHYGVPLAEKIAKGLGAEEAKAKHISGHAGDVIGYSIIFSSEILSIGRHIRDATKMLNDLRAAVRPISRSGDKQSVAPLSGDNEVVANARKKINGLFWQRLAKTATGAIATAPAVYSKINEQSARNAKRKRDAAYQKAKDSQDPKALEELEKSSPDAPAKLEAEKHEKLLRKTIDTRRAEYEARFVEFEKANKGAATEEVKKLLDGLTETNVHSTSYRDKLENSGFDVSYLSKQLDQGIYNSRTGRYDPPTKDQIKQAVVHFKDINSGNLADIADRALKTRFVAKEEVALDDGWKKFFAKDHTGDKLTIKQKTEKELNELRKSHLAEQDHDNRSHKHGNNETDIGKVAAGFGAAVASELATNALGGKTLDKYLQPIALDRILHLRRELEKAGDNPPDQVPAIAIGKNKNDKDKSYVHYVHDIFQQHQRDCGRPEIGDRFFEHFEKARWDDSAIQQMKDEELTAYEFAVKTIAKRIKDGRMDAIALISLVGDKQKKIVRDDAKSFGPRGAGKDDKAIKDAIKRIVDEQTMLLHAGQQHTDEQFNNKLGDFIFSIADLKRALETQEIDKHERAFIFTIFSDVVGSDSKLCQQLNISDKRCQELRGECKESFNTMLDGAVTVLADMLENDAEGTKKKLQLTDKQAELILSLEERQKQENKNVADITEDKEQIKSLETIVANAAMSFGKTPVGKDEEGKPEGFWQRLIAAARKPKQAETKETVAEAAEEATSHTDKVRHSGHKADHEGSREKKQHRHSDAIADRHVNKRHHGSESSEEVRSV